MKRARFLAGAAVAAVIVGAPAAFVLLSPVMLAGSALAQSASSGVITHPLIDAKISTKSAA